MLLKLNTFIMDIVFWLKLFLFDNAKKKKRWHNMQIFSDQFVSLHTCSFEQVGPGF